MDQVKQVMAQLVKHQFWIITGLATIMGVVGYYMTSSTLNKLYTEQSNTLNARFQDVSSVASALSTHPNDHSKAKMGVIIDKMAGDVQQAWELQYKRQEKFFVWPESALPNKRLLDKLKKYFPPETTLTFPEEPKSITASEKKIYADYFAEQMPRIVKIIGVNWVGVPAKTTAAAGGMMGMSGGGGMMKGGSSDGGSSSDMGYGESGSGGYGGYGGGGGGYPGMNGMNSMLGPNGQPLPKDLVIWPKSSQDELINSLRLWRGDQPTVYEIVYTQENMWILEGIMNIIAKTNEGAIENFQTTIKQIEFIRIGKPAVGRAGFIDPAVGGVGGGYGSMSGAMSEGDGGEGAVGLDTEDGGSGGGYSVEGSDGGGSEGGEGAAAVVADPANGRYVDATFAPITGEDLRTKMKSEGPDDAYFAVAKRVPVRLRFRMDQRKLPLFLANCGDADLMLEIRQVRIGNTKPAPTSGSMRSGPMGMGGMMGGGMGGSSSEGYGDGGMGSASEGYGDSMGMMGMGKGSGGMMGGGGLMGRPDVKPVWEMPIEVYGVVYLYNPVDIKKLGLDKVTEDTVVSDTVATPDTSGQDQPAPAAANNAAEPAANPNNGATPATDPAAAPNASGTDGTSGAPANPPAANGNADPANS